MIRIIICMMTIIINCDVHDHHPGHDRYVNIRTKGRKVVRMQGKKEEKKKGKNEGIRKKGKKQHRK